MDIIVQNIIDELNAQKITAARFSKEMGLYSSAVSEWKSGKSKSYLKYLPQIAEYLNITIYQLIGKDGYKHSDEYDNLIINMYNKLTPTQKNNALEYLKFLLDRDKSNTDTKTPI